MLAKIHLGAKELGLREDERRDVLERLTGHRSAGDCTDAQLDQVLAHFRTLGWKAKPAAQPAVACSSAVRMISAELKRAAPRLRPDALQRLLAHGYPGNIRELKNTLERAIIYAGRDELGAEHIVFAVEDSSQANTATIATATSACMNAEANDSTMPRRAVSSLATR